MLFTSRRHPILCLVPVLCLVGCIPQDPPAPWPSDQAWLQQDLFDDGRAEVAFYRVSRSVDPYGNERPQSFLVGTYLVKHDFDAERGSKALPGSPTAQPAFKYALFYEFESRSYEYKRSWVVNARRSDLGPMKASFASFDWCANQYREFTFRGTRVHRLYRSDDYGNEAGTTRHARTPVPVALMPLLVRGLSWEDREAIQVDLLLDDGSTVETLVRAAGSDTLDVAGVARLARRVDVTYARPAPSLIAEGGVTRESWWIGTGAERLLLAVSSADGRYRMDLVEHLRSAYWEEDLYARLHTVTDRP